MSAPLSLEKFTRIESAYIGAIDNALARRDFATARKLGEDWDKQAARVGRLLPRRLARLGFPTRAA